MSKNPKPTTIENDSEEYAIEQFKIKKLIQKLNNARGNGTSMISLVIPHKDDLNRHNKILTEEVGTATNIKSRVNRLSVLSAIQSTQQRLKLYNRTPPNGLVIYCGTVMDDTGKEKKVTFDIEPFKPINTTLYMCDNRFHTECLMELLENDDKYGFLIMDGNGSLYGTLQGSHRSILHKFSVDLPKKHGRGGQSAMRFARLRLEKRHNYVRKVGEIAVQMFITNDKPNVQGLILAGSAEFKQQLERSDLLDPRLGNIVLAMVDVAYGMEPGFVQAIDLAKDVLGNVRFVREKKIIEKFLQEVDKDTGKYCFGVEDTITALDAGAVETLILFEDLTVLRYVLRNPNTQEEKILNLTPEQFQKNAKMRQCEETGVDLETIESDTLQEWIVTNYKNFGAKLEIVSDRSSEGAQFCNGFGGIGGIMRYPFNFEDMEVAEFSDDGNDSDEWI